MSLDVATLHVSSALGRVAYLIVFTTVALRQPREICLWHWIGAILSSMVGSAIMARVPVTRWLSPTEAFTIYGFYVASLVLSWSGLRLFNDRSAKPRTIIVLTIVPSIVYVAALLVGVPPRMALSSVLLFCVVYASMTAFEALHQPAGSRLWSKYLIATTFGLYVLVFLLTLGVIVGSDIPINSTGGARMSLILDQATGVLVYFGYIAMAKERAVLQVRKLAETDPLTGLFNRRGLQESLARRREKLCGDPSSGVLLADIDHFKSINDSYGHEAGDTVLVIFADRLRQALRQDDIVVRWGGEEFLAILPKTDFDQLASLAERLRRAVEGTPFHLADGKMIEVTVSIGISEMSSDPSQFEPATRRADAALYQAKHGGRNRICGGPLPQSLLADPIGCAA